MKNVKENARSIQVVDVAYKARAIQYNSLRRLWEEWGAYIQEQTFSTNVENVTVTYVTSPIGLPIEQYLLCITCWTYARAIRKIRKKNLFAFADLLA